MRHKWWILLSNLFLAVLVQAAELRPDSKTSAPAVWVMESPYSFETTVNFLRDAITVVEQGDRVSVMATNPEVVVQQMHNPRLDSFRTRTASMYGRIVEEGLF